MDQHAARRQLLVEVLVPLLMLTALEAGLRWYVARTETLPLPSLLGSSIATGKYLAFYDAASAGERFDVILMGLSPMMVVDGHQLRDLFHARGHTAGIFNFALPIHSVNYDHHLLKDIIIKLDRPRLVVYGLMPFNAIYETTPEHTNRLVRQQLGFPLHDDAWGARLRAAVFRRFDLLLYRDVIRDIIVREKRPADPWIRRARKIDHMGNPPPAPAPPPATGVAKWEEQEYRPRLRGFQDRLRDTPLFDHIGSLSDFCRQNGMRLVLVNTAVHPAYMELLPNGREDYDSFVRGVAAAATSNGLPFLDLAGPELGRPETFVDTHHHNQVGAKWMTEQIGQFLLEQGLLDTQPSRTAENR